MPNFIFGFKTLVFRVLWLFVGDRLVVKTPHLGRESHRGVLLSRTAQGHWGVRPRFVLTNVQCSERALQPIAGQEIEEHFQRSIHVFCVTQGVALGYDELPRWGKATLFRTDSF
jgi:hypothetical protein